MRGEESVVMVDGGNCGDGECGNYGGRTGAVDLSYGWSYFWHKDNNSYHSKSSAGNRNSNHECDIRNDVWFFRMYIRAVFSQKGESIN